MVAKKRVTRTQVDIPQVDRTQDTIPRSPHVSVDSEETGLTGNQIAIRNGFLSNKSAAEVARDIGVSRNYVSKEYRKIKEELALTA
ncbi:hypothetical protein [Streptomyces sp. NBC_00872]|uniref:hypothetical protein n=1 Tax=Streptomyces sp. NBC_00872 TaxID=2903686 RepID=UPI003866D017|nr:hypothetical protein OG214_25050 [Streptomyces sp. NBC_00872]